MSEQDVLEVVDEIADDVDPTRVEDAADRLGLTVDYLLGRVVSEVKTRIGS